MNKKPVEVNVSELEKILDRHLESGASLNYALKIVGHPGVGKSAIVRQAAERKNRLFIDTRLAFKENVDLGGYPVPDPTEKRMIYYRPRFIPPAEAPEGFDGIVWFLDESNRAHPTVIQTLFQIITDRRCGEHELPSNTCIILAGNLGDEDNTTITDFDDSALDGRLVIVQLKPTASDWIKWANREGIHPAVIRYLSIYPEKLWDERNINPNPRGWHQVSQAVSVSYGLAGEEELVRFLSENPGSTLEKIIISLVGMVAGSDFTSQMTRPRRISTADVLAGNREKLEGMRDGSIPSEDILWAVSGALSHLREKNELLKGDFVGEDLRELAGTLLFVGHSRADRRISFFYTLLRQCGLFSLIPAALSLLDEADRASIKAAFGAILEEN
ncbi:MAG: hypothetical protein BWY96_03115 [Spirochaetes bacterium ADurb.BinA120]|nr:MAG: hypothetical protein BWY96_03115 [Spirochaetes bacterium ADurb.BinA120]